MATMVQDVSLLVRTRWLMRRKAFEVNAERGRVVLRMVARVRGAGMDVILRYGRWILVRQHDHKQLLRVEFDKPRPEIRMKRKKRGCRGGFVLFPPPRMNGRSGGRGGV